jgi:ribosomal protein S18 acetylase RimI-like enzyme
MTEETAASTFRIEEAQERDWPWIVQGEVEIAWVGLTREQRQRVTREEVAEQVAQRVAQLRVDQGFPLQAFVARSAEGARAGFVWLARTHNDTTGELEASLLNQYVAEPYRGRGLGRKLLQTAERWARDQGLPQISLSVGVQNTIGQHLYEGFGYEVETLRMRKRLVDD